MDLRGMKWLRPHNLCSSTNTITVIKSMTMKWDEHAAWKVREMHKIVLWKI